MDDILGIQGSRNLYGTVGGKIKVNREELIQLVNKIINCEGTEKEIDDMIDLLEKNVVCPYVSDLIYHDEKTPEEIVDTALAYKPIYL